MEEPACLEVDLFTEEFWHVEEARPGWFWNAGPLLVLFIYFTALLLVILGAILECFREKSYWQDDEFIAQCRAVESLQKVPKSVQELLLLDRATFSWVRQGSWLRRWFRWVQFKCIVKTIRSYIALDLNVAAQDVDMICEMCCFGAIVPANPEVLLGPRFSASSAADGSGVQESRQLLQFGIVGAAARATSDTFCQRTSCVTRSLAVCKMSVLRGVTIRALLTAIELSSLTVVCAVAATLEGDLYSWRSSDDCDFSASPRMVLRSWSRAFFLPFPACVPRYLFATLYKKHYMVDSVWDFLHMLQRFELLDIILWLLAISVVILCLWITMLVTANVHSDGQTRWVIVVLSAVFWRYTTHNSVYAMAVSAVASYAFWAHPPEALSPHRAFSNHFGSCSSLTTSLSWSVKLPDQTAGDIDDVSPKSQQHEDVKDDKVEPTEEELQLQSAVEEGEQNIRNLKDNHAAFLGYVAKLRNDSDAEWEARGRGFGDFNDDMYDAEQQDALYLGAAEANRQNLRDAQDELALNTCVQNAACADGLRRGSLQSMQARLAFEAITQKGDTPSGLGHEHTNGGHSSKPMSGSFRGRSSPKATSPNSRQAASPLAAESARVQAPSQGSPSPPLSTSLPAASAVLGAVPEPPLPSPGSDMPLGNEPRGNL